MARTELRPITGEWVLPLAIGLVISFASDASPTGSAGVDRAITAIGFASILLFTQHARPWAISSASLLSVALAPSSQIVVAALAIAGIAVAPNVSVTRSSLMTLALRSGLLVAAGKSGDRSIQGLSTLIFVVIVSLLVASSFRNSSSAWRRRTKFFVLGILAIGAFAVVGFAATLARTSNPLRSANASARAGLAALNVGDIEQARQNIASAIEKLDKSADTLDNPLTVGASIVPGVAQHKRLLDEIVTETRRSLRTINADLSRVSLSSLAPINGQIDLQALSDLTPPLQSISDELGVLFDSIESQTGPWLFGPAKSYVDELLDDIDRYKTRAERTLHASTVAPQLLGAESPRTYFIAFVTPSELRGSGGFMGNWAEVRVSRGKISMTRFGRSKDLQTIPPTTSRVQGPPDWIEGYGRYGFTTGPDGTTAPDVWLLATMSPQFPSTAQVISELYPQSGGREIDGVFAFDVDTLAALLHFTGPIEVPGRAERLSTNNARQFLLLDQYLEFETADRIDVLDFVARNVVDRLLSGQLPPPQAIGNTLSPLASEGRILAYSRHQDEQALFDELGLSGDLDSLKTTDTVVVSLNNASGNKIDYFLHGDLEYRATLQTADDGGDFAQLTITLRNSAPTDGYPDYVLGNLVGLPRGYSRLIVSTLTRLNPSEVRVDGKDVPFSPRIEAGLNAIDLMVDVPPGESTSITVELDGYIDLSAGYSLTTRAPLAVNTWSTEVVVDDQAHTLISATQRRQGFITWQPE